MKSTNGINWIAIMKINVPIKLNDKWIIVARFAIRFAPIDAITDVIHVLYTTQINLLVSLFIKYLSSAHPRRGTSKLQGTQKPIKYRSLFNDFFHFLLNQFHFLRVTTASVCSFQCTHIHTYFLKVFFWFVC